MGRQASKTPFRLVSERLGPLPIVNHFVSKLDLQRIFDRFVPTRDTRCRVPYATSLGVLLRSIIVEREPIYRHQELVSAYAPEMFGLGSLQVRHLADDQLGRALDHLFDADRGSMMTVVVVAAQSRFHVDLDQLHNDSTTVRFAGQYPQARGRSIRGKRAPWITYGHSKDHRPDLKQLLWVMSSTCDGAIPVQFRCEDGNTNDATTHIETWQALRTLTGRADFLYVADSKLCTWDNMDHLNRNGGRFVTVLPRTRQEDPWFRKWIQNHEPEWELVIDRPHPRRKGGPRDRWWVFRAPLPSQEGWPVIWVYSALLALKHQRSRQERLAKAREQLETLQQQLSSERCRLRDASKMQQRVEEILKPLHVQRYLDVHVQGQKEHRYRQVKRGRPGPKTRYRRQTQQRLQVSWSVNEANVAHDQKSDGMYPLLTNDRSLEPRHVLEAHKAQPRLEKRFQQLKSVHEIAPVLLKNEARIEAFFAVYFVALLVQALIEREIRRAMERDGIKELPLYPEERNCRHPTCQQVLRLFSSTERHELYRGGRRLQVFDPKLSELQREVLRLLGVPVTVYKCRK